MQIHYRIYTWLFTAALCLLFLFMFITAGTYKLQHDPNALDFLAFYTGAKLFSQTPHELYNLHDQHILQLQIDPLTKNTIFLPFINPPYIALLLQLIVNLSLSNAYVLFLCINVFLLVVLCFLSAKHVNKRKSYIMHFVIIGTATFIPLLISLIIGQFSLVLCLIFLITWLLLKNGKEFRSGLVLSLALFKPHFLILPFLALIVQRRFKVLGGLLTGIVVLSVISYLCVGWDGIKNYFTLLNSFYEVGIGNNLDIMQQYSLQTIFLISFHTQSLSVIRIPWIIAIICVAIPTLYMWSKKYPYSSLQFSYQFSLLIVALLLISPHTPLYDLSLLTIAASIVLSQTVMVTHRQNMFNLMVIFIGYGIFLIGYRLDILFKDQIQEFWISIAVIYLVFAWLALLVLLRKSVTNLHDLDKKITKRGK